MSPDVVGKLYGQFAPQERLTLMLQAMARGDEAEATRLGHSCPRRTYSQAEIGFADRHDLAFDVMAVVCVDLRGLCGKLEVLHAAAEALRHCAALHRVDTTMAYLEGRRQGKGLPQMHYYAKPPLPAIDDSAPDDTDTEDAAERAEDVDGDGGEGEPEDDEGDGETAEVGEVSEFEGDFARRMEAVGERSRWATEPTLRASDEAALGVAGQLKSAWAAYGRFCRGRLGVEPSVMLAAYQFPLADDFDATLKRYEHVEPDPAVVDELFAAIITQWDRRFKPEGDDDGGR